MRNSRGVRAQRLGTGVSSSKVCREGGARVRSNVFVRDLDLLQHNVVDSRRLGSWQGAQLAIDTTLVSPLHRDGRAIRGAAEKNGKALENARRKGAHVPRTGW